MSVRSYFSAGHPRGSPRRPGRRLRPVIAESYRPSPDALRRLAKVDFLAVVGPSAVGKTTLIRRATEREPRLRLVLNNTTRRRRPDELAGVDYRFETRAAMLERIARREYAQVAPNAFGDLYATASEDYPTSGIAMLPVLAEALPTFRALPFGRSRSVYVLPPDAATWRSRLAERGLTGARLSDRLAEARRSLELALADPVIGFVVNDDLTKSTEEFVAYALAAPTAPDVELAPARRVASELLAACQRA